MPKNKNNNNNNNNDAISSARERLQASAREILRNIESAMSPPDATSGTTLGIEQAFRSMFSSCTGSATTAELEDNDSVPVTPVSTQESSLSSRSRSFKENLRRLSMRSESIEKPETTPQRERPQPPPSAHIYEQLFFDDTISAKITPEKTEYYSNRRRKSSPAQFQQASPLTTQPQKKASLRPFPVSSPSPASPAVPQPDQEIGIPELNASFDDGISAISAHTLEAMARKPDTGGPRIDATSLHRNSTPQSRGSTSTTKSFEQWKVQEQEFWESEIINTPQIPKQQRSTRLSRNLDPFRHPHDTLAIEPEDLFYHRYARTDKHTDETGEI
jgi:hypothetical protein